MCVAARVIYIPRFGFAGLAAYQRIYVGVQENCDSAEKVVKRHEMLAVMVNSCMLLTISDQL